MLDICEAYKSLGINAQNDLKNLIKENKIPSNNLSLNMIKDFLKHLETKNVLLTDDLFHFIQKA